MRALITLLGITAALAAAACKEIPDSRNFSDGGDIGTGGISGTGGVASTGGGGIGGSTGGSGPCVATDCNPAAVPGVGVLPACCATLGGTGCGLDVQSLGINGCEALNQRWDPGACPSQVLGSNTYDGCCRRGTGTCGLELGALGCVATEDLGLGQGSSCTKTCLDPGPTSSCSYDSDCCDTSPNGTGASCVTWAGAAFATCTLYCTTNAECASGCCIQLDHQGRGACHPNASACSTVGTRGVGETCDVDTDCSAGNFCVQQFNGGLKLCRPACTSNAECLNGELCVQDPTTLNSACADREAGLCSDTCTAIGPLGLSAAFDGICEETINANNDAILCAYGTDCSDCYFGAAQIGGVAWSDNDSCVSSRNGLCEDGGPGSVSRACIDPVTFLGFGTDVTDCGPRLRICVDACPDANNGFCNDGSNPAYPFTCAPGSDCTDCGPFYGGRSQRPCDGSRGAICQGEATFAAAHGGNLTCECSDCGWDAQDCGFGYGANCTGAAASGACCAGASDACNWGSDGICDCGGWCGWETDCAYSYQATAPSYRCDGVSPTNGSLCAYPMPAVSLPYTTDGGCQCDGVCSWETDCNLRSGYICNDDLTNCPGVANGICEDGGPGSSSSTCSHGSDCFDCGARPGTSFSGTTVP